MDKKKKIAIVALVLVVAAGAAVLGFLFLDELAAQLICILSAMILAAVVLALSIEKESLRNLVLAPAPVVSVLFLKFFDSSELAGRLGGWYNAAVAFICQRMGMEVPGVIGNQTALAITFCIIVGLIYLIVWGVRSWIKGKTAASSGEPKPDKDFPERNYQQKRRSFCEFLDRRIDNINEDTRWRQDTFTPIEAEVELTDKYRKKRRYGDLHKCLRRRRKHTVFLVLGDPGSGKSVSMRRLCTDMMKEADRNKLIPVYVDLKRWTGDWSLEHPPTEEDLVAFIERILWEDGGPSEREFLKAYFRKMLERGEWYFVFDSFDELPCLMGRKSSQKLIDRFSRLLHNFLSRDDQNGGVIASRLFRSPEDALHASATLHLQPFSDEKIKKMLGRYIRNSDELVRALFRDREDLVALCRNPFYLSLLIEYIQAHGADFPKDQLDLYQSVIRSRLEGCAEDIDEMGLKSVGHVLDAARQLALYMQESSESGLEYPLSELYRCNDGYEWEKILRVLQNARLCRFGGASPAASFVHRRFQEYFYVSSIRENKIRLDPERYSSIGNNNDLRDALVLCCESLPLEKARQIADHCWSVLQQNKAASDSIRKPGCVELVNTLYFMAEAFRNRREAMAHFQADFQEYILEMLEKGEFVVQYAAVSSMVLFEQPQLLKMVLKVLGKENRYLSGVVMKNCRTMTVVPWEISRRMALHIAGMDRKTFLRQFWSMDFSLSLSRQLWYVRLFHAAQGGYELTTQAVKLILNPVLLAANYIWTFQAADWSADVGSLDIALFITTLLFVICVWAAVNKKRYKNQEWRKNAGMVELAASSIIMVPAFVFAVEIGIWKIYWIYALVAVLYFLLLDLSEEFYIGWKRIGHRRKIKKRKKDRHFWKDVHSLFMDKAYREEFKKNCLEEAETVLGFAVVILILGGTGAVLEPVLDKILILFTSFGAVALVFMTVKQCRWLRKQRSRTVLDRSNLVSDMKKQLSWEIFRQKYLEDLVERKVRLTGEWTDGVRPKMHRDDLDRLLAILDCGDLKSLRKEF